MYLRFQYVFKPSYVISAFRKLRHRLLPALDLRLQRLGWYASSNVLEDGYVGTVETSVEEFEDVLIEVGFTYGYVASLKARKCPDQDDVEVGSWVLRSSPGAPCQLHVHLFSNGDGLVDVYCHYEYNWYRRPVKHYRKKGLRPEKGSELMEELLDRYGVDYFHRDHETMCEV